MTEFPSDGEPSMVQAVNLRRLRRNIYMMPKIRSTPRAPAKAAPAMAPGRTALVDGLTVGVGGEVLDEEVLDDEEVLSDEEVLNDIEVLDDEEVVHELVAKDEVGLISVYLHPKLVEKIGLIYERTQTLDGLRPHMFPHRKQILRAYVLYSPTPWIPRRVWMSQSLGPLADGDQQGRPIGRVRNPMKFRRSLRTAIVASKNRWLYLFYRVDKDMVQLDRTHVPTRKYEGRCRRWVLCKHVRAILRSGPCFWGFINNSWVPIVHANVM